MIKGEIYEIRSRNLLVGVFDGVDGFIGIRTKFGSQYLFREYHNDGMHGTVSEVGALVGQVPEGVPVSEDDPRGTRCSEHDREVRWSPLPGERTGPWVHADDGSQLAEGDHPHSGQNQALFDLLVPLPH